jgi:cytochrome c biogenesis protein CcdA
MALGAMWWPANTVRDTRELAGSFGEHGMGLIEFGYLDRMVRRVSPEVRALFARPSIKASLMGLMVGLFTVGRPFPVFRDLMTYAATAENPVYGALIMAAQGLGQIAVMVALLSGRAKPLGGCKAAWSVGGHGRRSGHRGHVLLVLLGAGAQPGHRALAFQAWPVILVGQFVASPDKRVDRGNRRRM